MKLEKRQLEVLMINASLGDLKGDLRFFDDAGRGRRLQKSAELTHHGATAHTCRVQRERPAQFGFGHIRQIERSRLQRQRDEPLNFRGSR